MSNLSLIGISNIADTGFYMFKNGLIPFICYSEYGEISKD